MRNELRLSIILIALICFIVFSNKSRAADVYIQGGVGVPHLQFQFLVFGTEDIITAIDTMENNEFLHRCIPV